MNRFGRHRASALTIILLVVAILSSFGGVRAYSRPPQDGSEADFITGVPDSYGSTLFRTDTGSVGCRRPLQEETLQMAARDLSQELHPIDAVRPQADSGLNIVLRTTAALDANPEAKAAFLRAAQQWESQITTSITVVIDADFGTTWFGQPFPDGVAGLTNPQMLAANGGYIRVVSKLLDHASTPEELALYYQMPQGIVPTDQGDINTVIGPSALFRAIGLIDSIASPPAEPIGWGPPPAIGLNSNIDYDFDSSDGVDDGKTDFESLVAHEIGHVLGFESAVGQLEINPNCVPSVSVWDLFRFRPGDGLSSFSTATRVLSCGGSQVFFNGSDQLQLSSGRPDQDGGDGEQPSHWRDDSETGLRLGVMDPTIDPSRRQATTRRDLQALDLMGYAVKPVGDSPPSITSLSADLNGDILTLNVVGSDPDGDVVQAKLTTLDEKNHVLGESSPFEIDAGVPVSVIATVTAGGLGKVPDAMHAGLTLIDSQGNTSKMVVADFSAGDKGGPGIASASFKKDKLLIKGKRLGGQPRVEVNSVVVTLPSSFAVKVSNKKVTIEAPASALNLQAGPNRIRIINNGLRSNLFKLEN